MIVAVAWPRSRSSGNGEEDGAGRRRLREFERCAASTSGMSAVDLRQPPILVIGAIICS